MFNILIADDEKIERDGVKLLIKKFKMELNIFEAEDGEEAIEILEGNDINIVLTDIRMPFVNGLELCQKVREKSTNIKIIILSAYGEFEYAKDAINYNVFYYILKPIVLEEFEKVFNDVIQLCSNEKIEKEMLAKFSKSYQVGIEFQKEKALLDIINGHMENLSTFTELTSIDFVNKYFRILMIDFPKKFFDSNEDSFKLNLKNVISMEYEYLNLNQSQSLIFILSDNRFDRNLIYGIAENIRHLTERLYGEKITVVIGKMVKSSKEAMDEYSEIENVLENKFFFSEGVTMFTDSEVTGETIMPGTIDKMIDNICNYIGCEDFYSFEKGIKLFFDAIKNKEEYSVVYVKYLCVDILKKVREKNSSVSFKKHVEEIFACNNLMELMNYMQAVIINQIEKCKAYNPEAIKKVIKDVIDIIGKNYMNDISLECIAEKVFLSPSYLSYLFKKNIGVSIVKYITLYRLEKAKNFLENTNMKITDICKQVGYSNDSYFCMSFKKCYGQSPARYREMEE